jgi:ADP-ribose pyrophosphatase YjhB (NUDIX family)
MKNSHCSYCGSAFVPEQPWPRQCAACDKISYLNPLPVAVGVVPVEDGLLLIRRTVAPRIGSLALPGGYINTGESWQQACVREIEEETGLRIPAEEVQLFEVLSAPDGTVLIFGIVSARSGADLPAFAPNAETSETLVLREPAELAFPLHTQAVARFWKAQGKT